MESTKQYEPVLSNVELSVNDVKPFDLNLIFNALRNVNKVLMKCKTK